ncbi:MAG: hypothetical protein ACPG77_09295, partial [Nannocystaceae bacterium]
MRGSFRILGVCAVTVAVSGGCAHPGADIQSDSSPDPVKASPDSAVSAQSDSPPDPVKTSPDSAVSAQPDSPPDPV